VRRAFAFLFLIACGPDPAPAPIEPTPPPTRSAAQDRALRHMAIDVAEAQLCGLLLDRFVPLPEDRPERPRDRLPLVEGRLWLSECHAERRGDALALHLAGRGWQRVERSAAGPLGSSFSVRGVVRLEATLDLEAELDLGYDERTHRASVTLTPRTTPRARVTPIGTVPVSADGGWSSVVGGIGGLLGTSPEARARPMLEAQAAITVERELARGATLQLDLCTGQLHATLGALGDGEAVPAPPYADDEVRFRDNLRVRLRDGAFDLSGPFDGPIHVDLEVESGEGVNAAILCGPEAALTASAFLSSGETPYPAHPERSRSVRRGAPATLTLPEGCPRAHLYVSAVDRRTPTTFRYRVRDDAEVEPLVRCR